MRKAMKLGIIAVGLILTTAGCSTEGGSPVGGATPGQSDGEGSIQRVDALYDRLPDAIKKSGVIESGGILYPPYAFYADDNTTLTGAQIDLSQALGKVLGVEVRNTVVQSVPGLLTGIESERYTVAAFVGDTVERQGAVDFVDWVTLSAAFLVAKGNPAKIGDISDICGLRVGMETGSWAEAALQEQSATCLSDGAKAVDIQVYADQSTAGLAILSGRLDAALGSLSTYSYLKGQGNDDFDIAGEGKDNGRGDYYAGAVLPKGSALADIMLEGFQVLFDSGEYARIMKSYGIAGDIVDKPVINRMM